MEQTSLAEKELDMSAGVMVFKCLTDRGDDGGWKSTVGTVVQVWTFANGRRRLVYNKGCLAQSPFFRGVIITDEIYKMDPHMYHHDAFYCQGRVYFDTYTLDEIQYANAQFNQNEN